MPVRREIPPYRELPGETGDIVRFYEGLQDLARQPDIRVNFGHHLKELAGRSEGYRETFGGMVAFFDAYHSESIDTAINIVAPAPGIPAVVRIPTTAGPVEQPGRIIGLIGVSDPIDETMFQGFAAIQYPATGESNSPEDYYTPALIDPRRPGVVLASEHF